MAESMRPTHIKGYPVSYTTYTNRGCRCEGCLADKREQHRLWRQKRASPTARKALNKRRSSRAYRNNAEAAALAVNSNKPWTDEDRAVALRPDLTLKEAALLLGRTVYAVKFMRRQHRDR